MKTGRAGVARPGRWSAYDRGKSEVFFFSFDLADFFLLRPGRSCKQCVSAKRKCAMTEEESQKIRVVKRKDWEDGTEDGRG